MKKSTIVLCAAFLAIAAAPATAQQKMMNDMKDMPMGTMENNRMDKPAADQTIHSTRGKVTKVDGSSGMVTLAHEPVGTLNWPSMTMGFMVMDRVMEEHWMSAWLQGFWDRMPAACLDLAKQRVFKDKVALLW